MLQIPLIPLLVTPLRKGGKEGGREEVRDCKKRAGRGRKGRREREDKTYLLVGVLLIPLRKLLLIPLREAGREGGREGGGDERGKSGLNRGWESLLTC